MSNQRRELEKKTKGTMIFMGVFFVLALALSTLLMFAGIPAWLNGMIIVILAFVCYLPFLIVYDKMKKKKEEKKKTALKKKDPFAD